MAGPDPEHSVLLSSLGVIANKSQPLGLSRQEDSYDEIDFPEDIVYNPENLERPLSGYSQDFLRMTTSTDFPSWSCSIEAKQAHYFLIFQELDLFREFG